MPDHNIADKQHQSTLRLVVIASVLAGSTVGLINLILYFQVLAWQMLFVTIYEAVAVIGILNAYRLNKKQKINYAGLIALLSVFVGFGAGELVHEGLTLFLAVAGVIGIVIVGYTFLPRRISSWLPFPILYLVYIWLVNQLNLLPRYDVREIYTFRALVYIVVVVVVFFAVWQFVRVLSFGSVRTRLLTVIISMASIPAVLIVSIATYYNVNRSIQQTQYQLGALADLKINQVNAWFTSLETNIRLAIPTADQVGFTEMLLKEPEETELEFYRVIYEREKTRYQQVLENSQVFTEIFLVDLDGKIVVSTDDAHEGRVEHGYVYFNMGLDAGGVTPPFLYPYNDQLTILVVTPINNTSGEQVAMLAAQSNLATLDALLLERAGLGERGVSYLVSEKTLQLLTQTTLGQGEAGDYVYSTGISRSVEYKANGENLYKNPWDENVIGAYRSISERGLVLLSEMPQNEALTPVYQNIAFNVILTIGIVIVAGVIALRVAGRITRPVAVLASTVEKISAGDLSLIAKVEQRDEIGALAEAFNQMTAQLRRTLAGLEAQVNERTADLEQRTSYLQASADVSRAVASVLDPDQLITEVVELIRERFDLYYVGLFVLDADKQYATLRAGTGSAGRAMLARQHRIKVGSGMIGWCVANRISRVAQHAELDASRLANPDLPDTRSEAAIPLISRGEVIGAFTIQSTQPDIFDAATVSVFETMADQVAVALDNARLFVQSQQALESLRSVYGEITMEGWRKLLEENPRLGYRSEMGLPISEELDWSPELAATYSAGRVSHSQVGNGNQSKRKNEHKKDFYLGIPLKVRDQVIGVLGCYKSVERGDWSPEETDFMQDVGQTISVALESARFFNETQMRAENERLVAEVTGQLRQTLDVDTVLTTAVREIQRILGLADVEIRMSKEVEA